MIAGLLSNHPLEISTVRQWRTEWDRIYRLMRGTLDPDEFMPEDLQDLNDLIRILEGTGRHPPRRPGSPRLGAGIRGIATVAVTLFLGAGQIWAQSQPESTPIPEQYSNPDSGLYLLRFLGFGYLFLAFIAFVGISYWFWGHSPFRAEARMLRRFKPYFKYLRKVRVTLTFGVLCGVLYGVAGGLGVPVMIKYVIPRVLLPDAPHAADPARGDRMKKFLDLDKFFDRLAPLPPAEPAAPS